MNGGQTMKKLDIHNYKKGLATQLVQLDKTSISPKNKELIKKYCTDCALRGISEARQKKNIEVLRVLALMFKKDFDMAIIDDLKCLVQMIDKKELAAWTKVTHKVILKRFFKWLKGKDDEYPPEIKWLKISRRVAENQMLSQNELLTEKEIHKAIQATTNPRDKAIIAMLFEAGCRIGELGNLFVGNVSIDKKGAVLTVNGKTGARRVRIIQSVPYLVTWLNYHPLRKDPDAPLWITNFMPYKHMKYPVFCRIIRETFDRAGITKRCNPHLFRHSRASIVANHFTEFQMNHYFGWAQGSDMPSTYVHLSGKDLDNAVLKMNGLAEQINPETTMLKPRQCSVCDTINTFDSKYCNNCATLLTKPKSVVEKEPVAEPVVESAEVRLKRLLYANPDIQQAYVDYVQSQKKN